MKRVIYGGSFNPPGEHHRVIAERLAEFFDQVLVVPCGPRPDKPVTNDVDSINRAAMVDLAFGKLPKVQVELFDMEASTFTRTHRLEERFAGEGEIWHAVGTDLVRGGKNGESVIQREWERGEKLWRDSQFAVVQRAGYPLDPGDLPPHHRLIEVEQSGASSEIRDRVYHRQSIDSLVDKRVADYLERHGLYRGHTYAPGALDFSLKEFRPQIVVDDRNPQAREIASQLPPSEGGDPNVIVVIGGDGMMLRAIRSHWRKRLPFLGINAGHRGFLLNPFDTAQFPPKELRLQHLPLLWVQTEDTAGILSEGLAFNDAWVERSSGQTAWLQVHVNGRERLPLLMADGALVSTAAGSASYARAMGANPLPPATPALLLVGSNVLDPAGWKSAVLPLNAAVGLTSLDPQKRPLMAYIDGIAQGLVKGMQVRVSHTASVELLFYPDHDPAEKLAKIQFPLPGEVH